MRRTALLFMTAVLAASLAFGVAPAQAKGQTWTVIAGGFNPKTGVWSNAFESRRIQISVGDTVQWQFQGFHTVTFLGGGQPLAMTVSEGQKSYFNPKVFFPAGGKTYDGAGFANSGAPPDDPKAAASFGYALTFTKAGTYDYYCAVHGPAMSGTVEVVAKAAASPGSELQAARREQAAVMKAGAAAWAAYKVEGTGNAVTVPLIGDAKAGYSMIRFTPQPLTVKAGTTVTWVMRDPFEIHTVTFLSGGKLPEFIVPEPQKQGPPKLAVNPKVGAPAGGKTYDGTGYVNSGILMPVGIPGTPPGQFSLTFSKPGRYEYVCVVHAAEGMKGTIVVQ